MPATDLHKTHSLSHLVEISKQLYRQKKYPDALEAINAALHASPPSLVDVDLLDLQAATLSKLDHSKAALAAARRIIDAEEALPLGYLRAARILSTLNKPGKALQILQRGLRFCPPTSYRYDLLQREESKLAKDNKAVNFLPQLPPEIVELILQYLDTRGLVLLLKVCKSWRTLIRDFAKLWTHIDFSTTRKPVRATDVELATNYARGRLKSLALKGVPLQGSRLLELILRRNQSLESLTILSGGRLESRLTAALRYAPSLINLTFGGRVELDMKTAAQVLSLLSPKLKSCSFAGVLQRSPIATTAPPSMTALEHFTVETADMALRHLNPSVLFAATPALKSLKVASLTTQFKMNCDAVFSAATSLSEVHLEGSYACIHFGAQLSLLPRSVTSLTLVHTGLASGSNAAAEASFLDDARAEHGGSAYFQHLTHLRLQELEGGADVDVLASTLVAETGANLVSLEVGGGGAPMSDDALNALLASPRLKELLRLSLTKKITLDDGHASLIASSFQELRDVDLSNTSVSGLGVKALVSGLPKLHSLGLVDCMNVQRDAVEYAEKKGVKVRYGQGAFAREVGRSWRGRMAY